MTARDLFFRFKRPIKSLYITEWRGTFKVSDGALAPAQLLLWEILGFPISAALCPLQENTTISLL